MKNIVFISNSLGYGGASKIAIFVAEQLSKRGHSVCIINRSATGTGGYNRTVETSVQIANVDTSSRWCELREMVSVCRKFRADVVIGFTETPNLMARLVGAVLRIPSIISERGDPAFTGVGQGLKNRIVLKIINSSRGGVFQTVGARRYYGKGLQKRGAVIPNPVFVNGEIPAVKQGEREKSVVSVGRLDNYQKRYDIMLKAFQLFNRRHPGYVLKLYGDGPDAEWIKTLAEELGVAASVKFMGLTKHPMQDIAHDGMFLATSDFEGISNSLLEAMAAGLPCVYMPSVETTDMKHVSDMTGASSRES